MSRHFWLRLVVCVVAVIVGVLTAGWPLWQTGVENRPRPPFASLIGTRIGLHAGKHVGGRAAGFNDGMTALIETAKESRWIVQLEADGPGESGVLSFMRGPARNPTDVIITIPGDIVTSAIVATAKIGGVHKPTPNPTIAWQVGTGPSEEPSFAWILEDVEVLPTPTTCPGAQGVWTL